MSGPRAQCPSCGAPIEFRWSGAVQTTCAYCDSILVRHGADLERAGKVSEPPPVTSRLRLGSTGTYRERRFTVVGRIVYGYERGGWSEWHVVFDDGASGWVSDAMAEYSVSFLVAEPGSLPDQRRIRRGLRLRLLGKEYEVTDATPARYLSTEGELPWEYHDRGELTFADLKAEDGSIVTLDYSETPPLAFAGEYVSFASLEAEELRDDVREDLDHREVRTLNCPNCGGGVDVRHAELTVNVVCASCNSVLDAKSPGARVLQQFEAKARVRPLIPLGAVGGWKGGSYECLGFQVRTMHWGSERHSWTEYLLYDPDHGFRYLTEEDGHWNDALTLKGVPKEKRRAGHRYAILHGESFKHFEGAPTTTDYVLGEWPWEVRVGDRVQTEDFVDPPRGLSKEISKDETVWSVAEYVEGAQVWKAFGLEGRAPRARGVYANQPMPDRGAAGRVLLTAGVLVALLVGMWVARAALGSDPVLQEMHEYRPPADGGVVIGPFEITGRTANLAIDVEATVSNNWVYFDYALLHTGTGIEREFGREVGYYFGEEGGERWSEGSRRDRAVVPQVPAGTYMLRIVPESPVPVQYTVSLVRDVPVTSFWILTLVVLMLPAGFVLGRQASFSSRRWAESDYAD